MEQTKPFNASKGGNKPGWCLQNVRLGFGIAPLYNDAWTAWKNTEQHKTRKIPTGVDVPLYYDYTDKDGNRYGHINVQLKDGRVWSDGNFYKSLEDYEAKSTPVYVGWGESVNKVKVIGEEMLTEYLADVILRFYRGTGATKVHKDKYVGKITADKFARLVARNKVQVEAHEKLARQGRLDMVNHLPVNLRRILKGVQK